MKDADVLDKLAAWFQQTGTDDVGHAWGDADELAGLTARLLVATGRSIVRPADSIHRCPCGEIATTAGHCDRCLIRIGIDALEGRRRSA